MENYRPTHPLTGSMYIGVPTVAHQAVHTEIYLSNWDPPDVEIKVKRRYL